MHPELAHFSAGFSADWPPMCLMFLTRVGHKNREKWDIRPYAWNDRILSANGLKYFFFFLEKVSSRGGSVSRVFYIQLHRR